MFEFLTLIFPCAVCHQSVWSRSLPATEGNLEAWTNIHSEPKSFSKISKIFSPKNLQIFSPKSFSCSYCHVSPFCTKIGLLPHCPFNGEILRQHVCNWQEDSGWGLSSWRLACQTYLLHSDRSHGEAAASSTIRRSHSLGREGLSALTLSTPLCD